MRIAFIFPIFLAGTESADYHDFYPLRSVSKFLVMIHWARKYTAICNETTNSSTFHHCWVGNFAFEGTNPGELIIEDNDLKSLIEYNFENCAKVGLKVSTQTIFQCFNLLQKMSFSQNWFQNIPTDWKFSSEYYQRIAKAMMHPCEEQGQGYGLKALTFISDFCDRVAWFLAIK